jgi:hypothetical protein
LVVVEAVAQILLKTVVMVVQAVAVALVKVIQV